MSPVFRSTSPTPSNKATLQFVGTVTTVKDDSAYITIFSPYSEALAGLKSFSHVIALYWLHLNDNEEQRSILKVIPRRHQGAPEVGVFACRSPVRPNPIGLSVCKLLDVIGETLIVSELDAIEGTPILDIKPYISRADCIPDARNPRWVLHGPKT